jgi:uncharacterized protein (DUF433 family)
MGAMGVLASIIVSDPDVMSGTPCFRGTRVPLKNLMDYIEAGILWLSSSRTFQQ